MKPTEKIYQGNFYLQTDESTVLAAEGDCLILERTVFFPEGGGQNSDLGSICLTKDGQALSLQVIHVSEKDGVILHKVQPADAADAATFPASLADFTGAAAQCHLDWPHRFLNMQRHCGEHVLSAAFYELYGGVNRGFHMGADYMTIDISLEENPEFTQMEDEMVTAAELRCNELIWQDLPVNIDYYASREAAAQRPLRKALAIDEAITIVSLGDPLWAPGAVACCGTHPSTTGQVGLLKVYRWENYKGMARIYFDAGRNAFLHCREEGERAKTLYKKYSAEPHQLMEKIKIQDNKNQEARQQLYELKKEYTGERAAEILAAFSVTEKGPVIREYPNLKADDLLALGKLVQEGSPRLAVLVSPAENTMILVSGGKPDCGKIVKDNAAVWKGKGGGRPDNARALFPTRQDLDCFLDFLKKAY